jgi:hypothetical protein
MDAIVAGIRARGDRVSVYSHAQLVTQANAMIGPWLVAQAKARIAERKPTNLHKSRRADLQRLSLCKCQVQNGELNHRSPRAGFGRRANARRATGGTQLRALAAIVAQIRRNR